MFCTTNALSETPVMSRRDYTAKYARHSLETVATKRSRHPPSGPLTPTHMTGASRSGGAAHYGPRRTPSGR